MNIDIDSCLHLIFFYLNCNDEEKKDFILKELKLSFFKKSKLIRNLQFYLNYFLT